MGEAYLLTWSPALWPWENLAQTARRVSSGERVEDRWSCGVTRKILPGDRVFLLRQGADRPGLLAAGWATTAVFAAAHWRPERRALGKKAHYIDFVYEALLDPDEDAILPREVLRADPGLASVRWLWDTRASGVAIAPAVLAYLEARWAEQLRK